MERLIVLVLAGAASLAGNVVAGVARPGDGNCLPFACGYDSSHQQAYDGSYFGGLTNISGLRFFNTQLNSGSTSMNSGDWTIFLSTTLTNWDTLSVNQLSNLGAHNTQVCRGNLLRPWAFGNTLHVDFATSFIHDPAQGDLLVSIVASGLSQTGGSIYFDVASFNGALMSRSVDIISATDRNIGFGLVTEFVTTSGVPEAASGALLLGGLLLLARFRTSTRSA